MIGVLRSLSFCFKKPGDPAKGLRISDGKLPDPGVCSEDAAVERLSKPAAAMVAVAVAEAIVESPSLKVCESDRKAERMFRPPTTPNACKLL